MSMAPTRDTPPPELQDDLLLRRLGELPAHDVDPWRAEQIRLKGRQRLQREAARPAWLSGLARAYERVLEPALLLAISSVYLGWAVQTVYQILGR